MLTGSAWTDPDVDVSPDSSAGMLVVSSCTGSFDVSAGSVGVGDVDVESEMLSLELGPSEALLLPEPQAEPQTTMMAPTTSHR
jgi:hypothetical protein